MSQPASLLAFRKRLKNKGYYDIHIFKDAEVKGNYIVSAVEPLANTNVKTSLSLLSFSYLMR